MGRVDYRLNVNKEGMHLLVRCTEQESPRRLEEYRIKGNWNLRPRRKSTLLAFHCICLIVIMAPGSAVDFGLGNFWRHLGQRTTPISLIMICMQDLQQETYDTKTVTGVSYE